LEAWTYRWLLRLAIAKAKVERAEHGETESISHELRTTELTAFIPFGARAGPPLFTICERPTRRSLEVLSLAKASGELLAVGVVVREGAYDRRHMSGHD